MRTTSLGEAPANFNAVAVLATTWSTWADTPSGTDPPAVSGHWPAKYTVRPADTDTTWW